jgi:copper chaperone CopZ
MTKQNSNSVALKPKIATFAMKGMTCIIGCAKTIQENLTSMEGVQSATVDFDKKFATVEFDASKQTPDLFIKSSSRNGRR